MKHQNEQISKSNTGFSLVELLVALTILGILSAVSIPILSTYTQRAKIAKILTYSEILQHAYSDYYLNNGVKPNSLADMELTDTSTDLIDQIVYTPGDGSIGEFSININATAVGITNPPCSDVFVWFRPTYENKMLTWECRGYNPGDADCLAALKKIFPNKCYEFLG